MQTHVGLAEVVDIIFSRIEELKVKVTKTGIQKALADLFKTLKALRLDSIMHRPVLKYQQALLNPEVYIFKDNQSQISQLVTKITNNHQRISHYQQIFRTDAKFSEDLDKQNILKSQHVLHCLFNLYFKMVQSV